MEGIPAVDALVGEYLIFRGFRQTAKYFHAEKERSNDPQKLGPALSADSVMEAILEFVRNQNYSALYEFWRTLERRFFSRLPPSLSALAEQAPRLELALQRYFLVQAARSQKTQVLMEFFHQNAAQLSSRPEWADWFVLPYVQSSVTTHPLFEPYCSKHWFDAFCASLRNCLRAVFAHAPLPKLLQRNAERVELRAMQAELERLRLETLRLRAHVRGLEAQLQQAHLNTQRAVAVNETLHGALRQMTHALHETVQSAASALSSDRPGPVTSSADYLDDLNVLLPALSVADSSASLSLSPTSSSSLSSSSSSAAAMAVALSRLPLDKATFERLTLAGSFGSFNAAAALLRGGPAPALPDAPSPPKAALSSASSSTSASSSSVFSSSAESSSSRSTPLKPTPSSLPQHATTSSSSSSIAHSSIAPASQISDFKFHVPVRAPVGDGPFHSQPMASLRGHTASLTRARFSPDGEVIASASRDGSVRLWRVGELSRQAAAQAAAAQAAASRPLTSLSLSMSSGNAAAAAAMRRPASMSASSVLSSSSSASASLPSSLHMLGGVAKEAGQSQDEDDGSSESAGGGAGMEQLPRPPQLRAQLPPHQKQVNSFDEDEDEDAAGAGAAGAGAGAGNNGAHVNRHDEDDSRLADTRIPSDDEDDDDSSSLSRSHLLFRASRGRASASPSASPSTVNRTVTSDARVRFAAASSTSASSPPQRRGSASSSAPRPASMAVPSSSISRAASVRIPASPSSSPAAPAAELPTLSSSLTLLHGCEVTALQWDPSPANHQMEILYCATSDAKVKLWDIQGQQPRFLTQIETDREHPYIFDVAASPTDALIVVASGHRESSWWSRGDSSSLGNTTLSSASSGGVGGSDGGSGCLQTYSTKGGRLVSVLRTDPGGRRITTLSFNHNGNMLATGGADGYIRVFDMITSQPIMGWPAHQGAVTSVRFSSHETCIFSCGTDGQAVEWSLHRPRVALRAFMLPVYSHAALASATAAAHTHFQTQALPSMSLSLSAASLLPLSSSRLAQIMMGHSSLAAAIQSGAVAPSAAASSSPTPTGNAPALAASTLSALGSQASGGGSVPWESGAAASAASSAAAAMAVSAAAPVSSAIGASLQRGLRNSFASASASLFASPSPASSGLANLPCELAFDGSDNHFLVSSVDASLPSAFLFHVDSAHPLQQMSSHSAPVVTVDWHATSNLALTGSADHTIHVRSMTRRRGSMDQGDFAGF